MKRFYLILVLALVASTGSYGDVVVGAGKAGDVDGDGNVNSADVVAVYNYIIQGAASGITFEAANVNGDELVTSTDVVTIYNLIINGETKKVVSIEKKYSLSFSSDMLKVADLTVNYIDANNEVVKEPVTGLSWEKAVKAGSKSWGGGFPAATSDVDNTAAGVSLTYVPRNDYDKEEVYEISFEEFVTYNVVYDDGTTASMPAVDINPQTPAIEGQYVDNAMNAMCQSATNARDYDPENDRPDMSDYWDNTEEGYTPDPDMGGDQQVDPGTIIDYSYNDYEWVDLGLPSGLKWATRNVGARTPYELGGLYGWGDATGYHTESNNRYYPMSRPDTTYIAHTRMDIATVQWGPEWRMPSKADAEELLANCSYTREVVDGCEGIWFTSNINGEKIFMPCAGDRYVENIRSVTPGHANGYSWTADLYPTDNAAAYAFHWDGFTNMYKPAFKERYFGCSVRPVRVSPPAP